MRATPSSERSGVQINLRVVGGRNDGSRIALRHETFLTGRGEGCDLRPASELVSRRHCAVVVEKQGVRIVDLNSSNGTRVNGERISGSCGLTSGDRIEVGTLVFELEVAGASVAVPAVVVTSTQTVTGPDTQRRASDTADDSNILEWLTSTGDVVPPDTVEMQLDGTHAGPHAPHLPTEAARVPGVPRSNSMHTTRLPQIEVPDKDPNDSGDASEAASAVIGNFRQALDKRKRIGDS
jgi:pSer/pThr/pTyr-binding forkhead associated (FHA) protein